MKLAPPTGMPPAPSSPSTASIPTMQPAPRILLHEAFADQARRTPSRVALQEADCEVTYGELARRAAGVRTRLQSEGIGPGARVALHAHRSIEGVAGILGILGAGAAVVPVSPSDPVGRIDDLVRFAGLAAVVDTLDAPFRARWEGPRIRSDGGEASHASSKGAPGGPSLTAEAPAFILRSSGSTEKPKLIVRSHGSFRHRLLWTWRRHPFEPDDVGCQKAHLTTTHSIYELFEPLLQGAPVVLLADTDVRRLERFWELVRSRGVTRLLLVPSALRASLDMPGFVPPALKVLVLMGEYVSPSLAASAIQVFPTATALYSIYGSTEASSTHLCDLRADFVPGSELPLGVPISPDVRAEVLDPDGRPVGEGEIGRLHIGGPALFQGYLGDPERTAAVLGDRGEGRGVLYDTRDEVRTEEDGLLVFQGRVDATVKIRGFRVSLEEVERALLRHPGVTQAVVVVGGEAEGASRLDAWVAPDSVDRTDLFDGLRRRLPDYMVPSSVTPVDRFPLTPSGKVDRRELAERRSDRGTGEGERPAEPEGATLEAAALDPLARNVASAWEQVLGHREFGLDQSFFEVGGTSLSAIRVVQALRSSLLQDFAAPPEVNEDLLYRFPTVRSLTTALAGTSPDAAGGSAAGQSPLLVTLKGSTDPSLSPLFLISSAGGTVGVYERLVRHLRTGREVVGVRDPYLWGDRDPRSPTSVWAGRYVEAIRSRQPQGPYHVGAYSSAGSLGFEVARQLRAAGDEVAVLVLVDPLSLDRPHDRSFGFWASRATWSGPLLRNLVRLWGWLRIPLVRRSERRSGGDAGRASTATRPNDAPRSDEEIAELEREALDSAGQVLAFSALLEMNTGRPLGLDPEDLAESEEPAFRVLLERVATAAPEIDAQRLERIATQYPLQVRAQHQYRLRPLDAPTLLVEPRSRYRGLLPLLLRPHVRRLEALAIPLGPPTERVAHLSERFGACAPHFRCMRDDAFVKGVARAIDDRLGMLRPPSEAPVRVS